MVFHCVYTTWRQFSKIQLYEFLFFLLICKNSLCVLNLSTSLNTCSKSLACLLTLLMVSFDEQKFLILMKSNLSFFFFFFFKFIYLFLAVFGLRCCAWAFSSCGERGLLFGAMHGLLTAVASLVVEHGL